MTQKNDEVTARNFYDRSEQDQLAFTRYTWCDQCQKENLGLIDPKEYIIAGIVYIEGKCKQCASQVTTEITDEDF